jgi:uncharacterized repeat protein (TIGR04138 family)
MSLLRTKLAAVLERDPRYPCEAYQFVYQALEHTQKLLNRPLYADPGAAIGPEHHASGRELLEGIRDLALREFGLMARTVFRMWNIQGTADFGNIVFNLIDSNMMFKSDSDSRADFADVFDFDEALVHNYKIELERAE